MKRGGLILIIVILIIVVFIFGYFILNGLKKAEASKECSSDSDCVPSGCCHSSSCVLLSEKPDCSGIYCTEVCQPETLDCGQGDCVCLNGKCGVKFK